MASSSNGPVTAVHRGYDVVIRLLLIGDSSVGKSNILSSFCEERFSESFISTPGIYFRMKSRSITIDGRRINLQIWDTAGPESVRTNTTADFRRVMGMMLVYDITNEKSYLSTQSWLRKIAQHAEEGTQVMLVGNKCDLYEWRQVSTDRAAEFASSHGIKFMEVSAKESINISEAFYTLTKDILHYMGSKFEKKTKRLSKQISDVKPKKDDGPFLKRIFAPIFGGKARHMQVPKEITDDPYALSLYEKALRDGTETDRTVRINVVGNFGQGKTSLVRRLLRQKVGDVRSTDGIDVSYFTHCRGKSGKSSFRKAREDTSSDITDRLVTVALKAEQTSKGKEIADANLYIPNKEKQQDTDNILDLPDKEKKPDRVENTENETVVQLVSDNQATSLVDTNVTTSSNSIAMDECKDQKAKIAMLSEKEREDFSKKLKQKTPLKTDETSFYIWDFGGQFVFYATHTLFHSPDAIYLLVFDLSKGLDEVVYDSEFPDESSKMSMEYYLHFWMNSVHAFVGSKNGFEPKVILVGTHKDKIKGNTDAKQKYIKEYFNRIRSSFEDTTVFNHFHIEDFAVDNSISNDDVIRALRDTIIRIGTEQSSTVEIPAKWIPLERVLAEKKHIKIISFDLVQTLDGMNEIPLKDPEQIRLFLRYHHNKGTYVYYDEDPLSEYMVIDPQFLIDAFKRLITSERFCTNDPEVRPLWNLLLREGRLEEALISKQWAKDDGQLFMKHKEILLKFLNRHHIISEASLYDETTNMVTELGWYVVPSLLKIKLDQDIFNQFLQGKNVTIVRFVMMFDNSTIVPTVYHRLMASLIGSWPIAKFGEHELLAKDQCVVRLNVDHAGIAEMRQRTIELVVVNLCPSTTVVNDQADTFRRFVEAVINHELTKLQKCKDEELSQPYSVKYRCNHESHTETNGSIQVINVDTMKEQAQLPCPDLLSHSIQTQQAIQEWTIGPKSKLAVKNAKLTDKILSRISRCVGKDWQLLGQELGIAHVQIDQITEDYPNSVRMRIYYMLKTWCNRGSGSADLNVLIEKIQECATLTVDWDEIRNIVDDMN